MNILIIQGHPNPGSLCQALADAYASGARSGGHTVQQLNLHELSFDPILRLGYSQVQPLEPDLLRAQELVTWCHHLVVVYPSWWVGAPALLKGFFDRTFLPGWAFKYRPNSPFWDKLLAGRTARIINTSDAPSIYSWLVYRHAGTHWLKKGTLAYCGFSPVRTTIIDRVRFLTPEQISQKLKLAGTLGQAAK